MPFQAHSALGPPEDRSKAIWRYVDLARLLWVLQERALWFARADKLGDYWEGSLSIATLASADHVPRIGKAWRLKAAVSCWHMNEHESVAMWDRYARSDTGLAIRSSIQRLIDSLDRSPQNVFLAPVGYIDYDNTPMRVDNALYPLTHKRMSFAFEQELRAITMFPEPTEQVFDLQNNPVGITVPVDVVQLIEAIYVAPSAPSWFLETAARSIAAIVGTDIPVRQSRLGADPLF